MNNIAGTCTNVHLALKKNYNNKICSVESLWLMPKIQHLILNTQIVIIQTHPKLF